MPPIPPVKSPRPIMDPDDWSGWDSTDSSNEITKG